MRYALLLPLLISAAALGSTLYGAYYDSATDEIVAEIAYRGTHENHRFVVEWGECHRDEEPNGVAGRIIDLQGDDIAEEPFRVRARLSVAGIPCRPARVTLRLGLHQVETVLVPAAPLGGAPEGAISR